MTPKWVGEMDADAIQSNLRTEPARDADVIERLDYLDDLSLELCRHRLELLDQYERQQSVTSAECKLASLDDDELYRRWGELEKQARRKNRLLRNLYSEVCERIKPDWSEYPFERGNRSCRRCKKPLHHLTHNCKFCDQLTDVGETYHYQANIV